MLVCLSLGAIGVGIYVTNFRSKPENKNKSFSVATVSLIMVSSFLVGLLVFGIYYGLTYDHELTCEQVQGRYSKCNPKCPTCPACIWGPEDQKALARADNTVKGLQAKAVGIPRNLRFRAQCDDDKCAREGKSCCGVDTDDIVFAEATRRLAVATPAPRPPAAPAAAQRRPDPKLFE